MRWSWPLLVLFTGWFPSAVFAGGGGKVAVLDIQATGLQSDHSKLLTEILSTEIDALGYFDSVISGQDIATMMGFERQRDLLGCTDGECLAELGGALGVDRIIAGHVGKLGTSYIVQIKLINIVDQKTERRIYEKVDADDDLLIQTIKDCVSKLLRAPGSTGLPRLLPMVLARVGLATLGGGVYFGLNAGDLWPIPTS